MDLHEQRRRYADFKKVDDQLRDLLPPLTAPPPADTRPILSGAQLRRAAELIDEHSRLWERYMQAARMA